MSNQYRSLDLDILCVVSVVLFMSGAAARAQDSCRDILVDGVHNTYQQIHRGNEESDLFKALCTSSDGSSSHTRNVGGGAGWGPFTLNVNTGSSDANAFRNAMCSKDQSQLTRDDYNSLLTSTIDPYIVQNWRECMAGGGLKGNVDVNADQILFTLEWRGMGGVASATVNGAPTVRGVTCDSSAIAPGTVLYSNVPVTIACTRSGKSAVTYVVNTTVGSKVLKLSALPEVPKRWERGGAEIVEAHLQSKSASAAMSCCNMLVGYFIVPQPGVAASTYGAWKARFTYHRSSAPTGMAGFQNGNWQPGDKITFELPVPKEQMDPFQGNDIRICVGAVEDGPCMQTPNLLTLPLE